MTAKLPAHGKAAPANPPRPTVPATKAARQSQIVAILSREQVHSQEQLAGLLTKYAGLHVAQATLSRDLDELGVVRLRAADGTLVYAPPGDPGGPGSPPGTGLDPQNFPERYGVAAGSSIPAVSADNAAAEAADTAAAYNTHPTNPASHSDPTISLATTPTSPTSLTTPTSPTSLTTPTSPITLATPTGRTSPVSDTSATSPTGRTGPTSDTGPTGTSTRLTRYLRDLLTSAEASANLVVLRTPAGAAQFLASAIDHAALPAILGTVAGDDTVLVISRDPAGGDDLAAEFRRLAESRR